MRLRRHKNYSNLAVVIFTWPPYSPDLNPIETLWKHMKEYLQAKYGDCKFRNYKEQRQRVQEAWDTIATPGILRKLIENMLARM
jgi:transposase